VFVIFFSAARGSLLRLAVEAHWRPCGYAVTMRTFVRLRSRFEGLPPVVVDGVFAALIAATEMFNSYYILVIEDCHCDLPAPAAITLAGVSAGPLVWRRRWPFWTGVAVGLFSIALDNFETPYLGFAAIVAVYTVSAYGTAIQRRIAMAFVVFGVGLGTIVGWDFESLPEDILTYGTAWVLGALQRTRRAYMTELEARAERLEREREDRARLAGWSCRPLRPEAPLAMIRPRPTEHLNAWRRLGGTASKRCGGSWGF
jgi:hypothetical protein